MLKVVNDYLNGDLEIPVEDGKVDLSIFNLILNSLRELDIKTKTFDSLLKKYIELNNEQSLAIIELNSAKPKEEVNHPKHYNSKSKETIQVIQESMNHDEYLGFLLGNVIKYLERHNLKGGKVDLKKAEWYFSKYLDSTDNPRFQSLDLLANHLEKLSS